MFEEMLTPYGAEKAAFAEHWVGPTQYISHKRNLIAKYWKIPGGDGQSVFVYCTPMPARFYELEVRLGADSVGGKLPGYTVSTGSSEWGIAAEMALKIAEGMITFRPAKKKSK